ncbi:hypothetical protein ATSB10_24810 [Dyella thiooxydans]|uniref:DUF2383 domain-containing protein n=1 Tax=Dyella thiooxydans TaxID=445710 RepID=A0A161J9N1_9GAMM|nr:DUF2383 domain-containing protein [Dyella thiooxydans]AND69935.1 hypothetical protein ATSB10_24810 [Dyella thiooxydans]
MALATQPLYNALIRRSIDLQRLCQLAAQQVVEPGLRVVLLENAAALELFVLDLQMELSARGGRPATTGRWRGPLQRRLASWWARGMPLKDTQWIRLLSRREAVLVRHFEEAMALAPIDTAQCLRRLASRLQAIHLDMGMLAGVPH